MLTKIEMKQGRKSFLSKTFSMDMLAMPSFLTSSESSTVFFPASYYSFSKFGKRQIPRAIAVAYNKKYAKKPPLYPSHLSMNGA